jgi:hypothetical protein
MTRRETMKFNEDAIATAGVNLLKAKRAYQEAHIALLDAEQSLEDAKHVVEVARHDLGGFNDNLGKATKAYADAFKKAK